MQKVRKSASLTILVAVKPVPVPAVPPRVAADGSGLLSPGPCQVINPFDEVALESALRLREAGMAREVLAVACGDAGTGGVLRHALALGADRALQVFAGAPLEPLGVARLLKGVALREAAGLILLGRQAVDDDACQVAPLLAAMLGWPQACFARALTLEGGEARVECTTDAGSETLALSLPAVVSAELALAVPRAATPARTQRAGEAVLARLEAGDLARDLAPRLRTEHYATLPARAPGQRVEGVAGLAAALAAFVTTERAR
ncbi:MAG: electron transfer flavoprotein subunit beta/FixA family protein [Candidatus Dactylopiibacterium sp.]|nr:electron transfer flavoprotein subunit beta/FixA family protein [Candidatus Dactylopiibacterium sp.]